MLVDDIRARLAERLAFLGQGAKSNFIKDRLAKAGLSETYLDQVLVSRRDDRGPLDPTITKIEALAKALDVSLAWLVLGVGRPETMFSPKPDVTAPTAQVIGGLQRRINQRSTAKKAVAVAATKPRRK